MLDGLDGKFIALDPFGTPLRGRLNVLPTGRNFDSVDNRAVPTPITWKLGQKSAESLVLRHLQDHGHHLRSVALSVWGAANMRTSGDDIAQAMILIGAKPVWDPGSLRVSGYEIIAMGESFTWDVADRQRDLAAARKAWEHVKSLILGPNHKMVLLEELNICPRYDYLPIKEVVEFFKNKPADTHVIVTGRNAKDELIEIADLITEMTEIKHHFRSGVKAQIGIEF
ncbi:MAG: cobaltochelatase subunit CobN [Candidatus Devosia symbiotica]|nr:cobaltochelatase subunit CobN [Candidatus Devosia symbiotica]